jgi:hypothetical protein
MVIFRTGITRITKGRIAMYKLLLLVLFSILSMTVGAADKPSKYSDDGYYNGQYGQWQGEDKKLKEMINELRELIKKAEDSRAADRHFLRDLKKLAARYERKWQVELLHDDFSDGNYTHNPQWTVVRGRFWVDRDLGLYSKVRPAYKESGRDDDLSSVLADVILGRGEEQGNQRYSKRRAIISIKRNITSSFSVNADISNRSNTGRLILQLYTGNWENKNGYRLVYRPGDTPVFRLIRMDNRGGVEIASSNVQLRVDDQHSHHIEWNRTRRGKMRVLLDGTEIMSVKDNSYRNDFNEFVVMNTAGEFALREISIYGDDRRQ